jgi:hypothetical protein
MSDCINDLPPEAVAFTSKTLNGPTHTEATWTNAYGAHVTLHGKTVTLGHLYGYEYTLFTRAEAIGFATNALPDATYEALAQSLSQVVSSIVQKAAVQVKFGRNCGYGTRTRLRVTGTLDTTASDVADAVYDTVNILSRAQGAALDGFPTVGVTDGSRVDKMTVNVWFAFAA